MQACGTVVTIKLHTFFSLANGPLQQSAELKFWLLPLNLLLDFIFNSIFLYTAIYRSN